MNIVTRNAKLMLALVAAAVAIPAAAAPIDTSASLDMIVGAGFGIYAVLVVKLWIWALRTGYRELYHLISKGPFDISNKYHNGSKDDYYEW